MGAFFQPSEEPGVKRAKRSGATLIPGSSDGTLCAAIAEQMSGVARSLRRKTLSLSPPCGWVHFKLPKWVKSKLALTQLAEHAREATPYGMQRLLSQAVWDADLVRDDLRAYVLEQLGHESAILVMDESSFPKRGKKSAGVKVQYCGTTGHVENCQVGVFLAYVTAKGHTLIDRELYLPLDWIQDHERCQAASIPETIRFQTKPELAVQMLERIFQAAVPIAWVVADTVYGSNLDLRTWLEAHAYPYVLAVACNEPVGILTPNGERRQVEVSEVEALLLDEQDWQCLSMSEGTKGPRLFDWACVPILHQWEEDGRHWLLIRRSLTDPQEKAYYFVF